MALVNLRHALFKRTYSQNRNLLKYSCLNATVRIAECYSLY